MLLPYRIRKFKFLNILSEVSAASCCCQEVAEFALQSTIHPPSLLCILLPTGKCDFYQSPCRNRFTRKFSVQFYFAVQELGLQQKNYCMEIAMMQLQGRL